mmetsp:Transcript_110337/g.312210  ORF Transcript_110337/g.312210 Transcript_110337/m.312210 type:complete len:133 (+) Transcript_110337:100-498(+)|eukprot:CAMPEP_0179281798 /NCGR_PEP_ID=MMETSP0797-20121207/37339_1 /TAXON_ID=47934 /ORGANISM="Dinophysis acuminata, Strain DAEP01" /LENGTH=132 /DNA_ID=CAMNT_0020990517 /DNA_START=91 /DNA_END=489 /DNA_ORIENTATION=+
MNADEEKLAKQQAQMQAQGGMGDANVQKMQEEQAKRQEMEERKRMMIRQCVEPDALERLQRVGLVKPDKQRQIEESILSAATTGRITEKVSDTELIRIIEKIDKSSAPTTSVKIQRKKRGDDSDDDIDLDNL